MLMKKIYFVNPRAFGIVCCNVSEQKSLMIPNSIQYVCIAGIYDILGECRFYPMYIAYERVLGLLSRFI
jgi:hypothetical protein